MAQSISPKLLRLFVEILVVIVAAEFVIMMAMAKMALSVSGAAAAFLDVGLLSILAGPLILWRIAVSALRHPGSEDAKTATRGGKILAWPLLTLLIGVALSLSGAYLVHQEVMSEGAARFDGQVARLENDILDRFDAPLAALRGLQGHYTASKSVDRQGFRDYWSNRDVAQEFSGVRGFGFIQRILRPELERFTAAERKDGAPGFTVKTSGNAPDLYVIKLVEPLANNLAAQGLDIGREPVRREGAERAIRTRQPALTGTITLVQDGRQGPGFLYLLPVFRSGADFQSPGKREAALVGLVYSPIVVNEIMVKTAGLTQGLVDFELFDGPEPIREKLIFDLDQHLAGTAGLIDPSHYADRLFERSRRLAIGGRALTLRASSTPAFEATMERSKPMALALGGTLLSALVAFSMWLLAMGRIRAEARALVLTADMKRLATVAERTNNSVVIGNANNEIVWVNDAFTRVSGFSLEEALGHKASLLRNNEATDPVTTARIREALARCEGVRLQTYNRTRDGRDYWLDADIQPLLDEQGNYAGYVAVEMDITAAKHAEVREKEDSARLNVALRETDALMKTLHQHAIVSEADAAGLITNANEAFTKISGYSREELLGKNHRLLNSGVQPRSFWIEMWQTISAGKPWRGQVCNRAKDGSLYWVDSLIAPFLDQDGKILKYISIRFDVTAAKAAQVELTEQSQRLQNILEGTNVGTWEVNLQTGENKIDARWASMLGYPLEELEPLDSARWLTLSHADDMKRSRALMVEHVTGNRAHYEFEMRLRHKDGHWVWVLTRGKVSSWTPDGRAEWMSGTHMDISERKRAENDLTQTSAQLRTVLDAASEVSVIAVDLQGRVTLFNKGAERMLGYTFKELVGQNAMALLHDPQEIQAMAETMSARLQRPIRSRDVLVDESMLGQEREWTYFRKNGERVKVLLAVAAMHDNDGALVGYLGVSHDITRQKEYEASLHEAVARAELATVAKSQFLANMSHEIRTPMNAILGMLKLLQSTPLTPRQVDYASKTEGAARSLLGLLNDILDFSKVEAGKMTFDPHPFRFDRLMRDLSVILSANVGQKSVEVLFDIDPSVPKVLLGDSMRLQQVLINLGGNAIKFTERGEVVVRVHVVDQGEQDVVLEISVQDSGIGIAPENQLHIFDGFSQAEASTTRRFGGTGLGLAICKRLVALMGGDLMIKSEVGKGSTFHFRLPMQVADQVADDPITATVRDMAPLTALIVDDNPTARDVLVAMMKSLGWRAEVAAGGAEALALIKSRSSGGPPPYQAIFMDWQMPDMDGWETSLRIRQMTDGETAPIVVMVTAHGREMLAQRSSVEQALLNGFLVKPVTASMLLDAVIDARASLARPAGEAMSSVSSLKRLAGMRLLVVEDNAINQQVAQELLSAEGALVELAGDGQQGVAAVAAADPPFDVVLMDVQMPVMDGFAATRAIRTELGLTSLPVIAMTANAMQSDREACLESGMNDHMGKPFDLNKLVAMLLRYAGPSAVADSIHAAAVATGAKAGALSAFQSAELDVEGALNRMGGDSVLFLKILNSFVRDIAALPEQLSRHMSRGELAAANRLLHSHKGLAATVGARQMAAALASAEAAVKQGQISGGHGTMVQQVQAVVASTTRALAPVIVALEPAAQSPAASGPAPARPVDQTLLMKDLQQLHDLLRRSDMGAMAVHAQFAQHHAQALGDALSSLDEAMSSLDFGQAAVQCEGLMQRFKT